MPLNKYESTCAEEDFEEDAGIELIDGVNVTLANCFGGAARRHSYFNYVSVFDLFSYGRGGLMLLFFLNRAEAL